MDTQDFMPDEAVIAGIKADLERYEAERRQAHRAVMWRRPAFIGVALAVMFAIAWFFNGLADPNEQWFSTPHVFLYFFGFFGLFFVHSQALKPATRLQQSLREKILPVIFGFIENLGYRHEATPDSYGRLPQETVGSFNRQSFDDVISGRYEGFPFELYEATLRRKAGKSTSEVFKGVIVAFETLTPFPGVLVAHQTVAMRTPSGKSPATASSRSSHSSSSVDRTSPSRSSCSGCLVRRGTADTPSPSSSGSTSRPSRTSA
jgi:hypothetical protein